MMHVMFQRIGYSVPEEWAQLAGSVALIGSRLLQGKLQFTGLNPGQPIH